MPRTATVTLPYMTALASANSAPIWNASTPGLVTIITPLNPVSSTHQRTGPARSLSQRIESSAAHNGAEKLIATAPASGIRLTAMTVKVCEIDCDNPRAMCAPGRRVANTAKPDDRQHDHGAEDQPGQRAEEHDFADRIDRGLPLRDCRRDRQQHGRRHHPEDAERHIVGWA